MPMKVLLKAIQKALRELITFLNKSEWMDKEVEIQTPEFDLPLKIDEKLAIFYARHNSPFAFNTRRKRLKAEQTLFTAN